MDYRIQSLVMDILHKYNLKVGDYDLIAIKGGAGNFQQLQSHLEVSKSLHDPQLVILTIHSDCGAGASIEDFNEALNITKDIFHEKIPIQTEFIQLH